MTVLILFLFLSLGDDVANAVFGCESAEKKMNMTIDTYLSVENATHFNFIDNYNASSGEQCIEDCCNKDACNIVLFRYDVNEVLANKTCVHLTCYPLDACVFRESGDTILTLVYRYDNISDDTEIYEYNQTENSYINGKENLLEKEQTQFNHEKLHQNFPLANSKENSDHISPFNNSTLDSENLDNIFSKFVGVNFTMLMNHGSKSTITSNYQSFDSQPSIKKQLQNNNVSNIGIHDVQTLETNTLDTSHYIKTTIVNNNNEIIDTLHHINHSTTITEDLTVDFIRAKKEVSKKVFIYIVAIVGAVTIIVIGVLIVTHLFNNWKHRHYSKMNYLIDGMYNWNDDKE